MRFAIACVPLALTLPPVIMAPRPVRAEPVMVTQPAPPVASIDRAAGRR